jgi:hypothetical protein
VTDERKPRITDAAIDRVAREMLDAEPAADLRRRVLTRIDGTERSTRWVWIALPLATAAVVILAILLWRPAGTSPTPAGTVQPPLEATKQPAPIARPVPPVVDDTREPERPAATARAAATTAVLPAPDDQTVAPLSAPEPLSVPVIENGRATPMNVMQVVPISLKPLEVDALDETPQARPH